MSDITAVTYGGDDWYASDIVYFYARASAPLVNTWVLIGSDDTPTMPDAGHGIGGFTGEFPRNLPALGGENWKAFSISFDTTNLPAGLTSTDDFLAVACGQGTASWGFNPGGTPVSYFGPDRNNSFPFGPLPFTDCDGNGAATSGQDLVPGVTIKNVTAPAVVGPAFPADGYHGDALLTDFTLNITTSPDAQDVWVAMCTGVNPETLTPSTAAATFEGGGGCTAIGTGAPATDTVRAQGAFGHWTVSFAPCGGCVPNASTNPYFYPSALVGAQIRLVIGADGCVGCTPGVVDLANMSYDSHYIRIEPPENFPTFARNVWDYQSITGSRACRDGVTSATSTIDPGRLTDFDGDGVELLATSPSPAAGKLDINDGDNPVLKSCFAGPGGFSSPIADLQIATNVSGVGNIDTDTPTYRDRGAGNCEPGGVVVCTGLFGPAANTGGFFYGTVPAFLFPGAGGYARIGSTEDPPLIDLLGRMTSRVCALGTCQHEDITDGVEKVVSPWNSEAGADFAVPNSLTAGTSTYTTCVDKDGDEVCGANDGVRAAATMTWTPGGRNHNHLWVDDGSATPEHGTSTIAAPAGSTVDLIGFFHDAGHNGVANASAIWRFAPGIGGGGGNNAPGHFVSTDNTTASDGSASATIGSSVLDAGRTANVLFCGDGDHDGICDQTPAQVDINWGGPVTVSSISAINATPTTIVFGNPVTVSGSLSDSTGGAISSATVTVERRTLGDTTWVPIGTDTSDGNGDFVVTDHPAFSSDYRAVFGGNVSYTSSTSSTDRVWVRVGVALNASRTTALVGQAVRLSGRVLPAHPGMVVTLQYLDDGHGWVNVATTHLSAGSTYAFSVTHGVPRSALYRVSFPTQTIVNAWNVSRNIRVTWT